jgi:hypothetical protein
LETFSNATQQPENGKTEFGNFVLVVDEGSRFGHSVVLIFLFLLCSLCRVLSMFLLLVVLAPSNFCLSYLSIFLACRFLLLVVLAQRKPLSLILACPVFVRGIVDVSLVCLFSLLFVLFAPRKLSLPLFSAPYFEPRSDKDLGESLRDSLQGDFLGSDKALSESIGEILNKKGALCGTRCCCSL